MNYFQGTAISFYYLEKPITYSIFHLASNIVFNLQICSLITDYYINYATNINIQVQK